MAGEVLVEQFGRRLPIQSHWAAAGPRSDLFSLGPDRMLGGGPFSKDGSLPRENSARSQKLPSVSHLLGMQSYTKPPTIDRTFSTSTTENRAFYHGPHHGYGQNGEQSLPAPSELYRQPPHAHPRPPHYRQSSDVTLPSPFSNGHSHEALTPQSRSVSSFPSPGEARVDSGSQSGLEQPRIRRVLREEDIPNKGVCYIYDDGSFCPKAVDGDSVNPQWGITKAGKPRKRLAQACTTCREKKIRCDPGIGPSQCLQCMKFRRECRFEPLSRSGQRSPSLASTLDSPAPDAIFGASPAFQRDSAASTEQSYRTGTSSKISVDVEPSLSPLPLARTANGQYSDRPNPSKKPRTSSSSPPAAQNPDNTHPDTIAKTVDDVSRDTLLTWEVDPWEVDNQMTRYYLEEYFNKVNRTTYCMFPRQLFMRWVKECRAKSAHDKMLLYAMLALGSMFATHPRKKEDGRIFSRIAHHAVSTSAGEFDLQMVQTGLILALYDYANGSPAKGWEFTGAAVWIACGMKLNVEEGLADLKPDESRVYGLERSTLIECRRRTFWSAYMMDRFSGFCSGHLSILQNADCLVRLPCNEIMYEEGNIPQTPFFDREAIDSRRLDRNYLGMMAYLVQIASIWGDVQAAAYRLRYQPPSPYRIPFEDFYDQTTIQLTSWATNLDEYLKSTPDNIDKAGQGGYLGTYGAMHALYHYAVMRLNRHARYHHMRPDHVARNVKIAHEHAGKTLDLMRAISKHSHTRKDGPLGFAVNTPFVGFAILTAIDILTATGSLTDLFDPNSRTQSQLSGGIEVMSELAEYWSTAKIQLNLVAERYENLLATLQPQRSVGKAGAGRTSAFFAREPLEVNFGLELDLVYSMPRRKYLEALGWGSIIRDGDEMLEVQKRGSDVNTVAFGGRGIFSEG